MRLALAAGGVLLLALLTWLLLHGIDTRSSAYAEIQRAFDDFALAEASIGRDVLQARAGLLGNYDVLVKDERAMENALSRIRLHMEAEKLDPKPVDRLAISVTQYGDLIERFKTANALLQNSLSYVGQLSTDPSFGALGDQIAPSATALASAVLRLAGDSSLESSSSLQEQIKRFEAQAPTDGLDAAHALLAHARLLSNLLPEVEQTLRAFVATPGRQPLDEARQELADAQASFESTAQRFRVLLYIASLGLLVIALRLGVRLWTRTLKIRRLVDANIIGIFMFDNEGNITEVNDTFLNIMGYDREDLRSARLRWADLTPAEGHDRDERCSLPQPKLTGSLQPTEKEYIRKDGSRLPVLVGAATFEDRGTEGVAFLLDLTERKRAEERLRVEHIVAQILAEAATIEEVTPRILRAMGECLGWDVGALWRVDRKTEELRCVELWHRASIEVPEFERVSRKSTFVPGLGLPGRVWSSLQPEYVPDVVLDENFPRAPIAEREELHAALAFPILLGGKALGVIEFFSREIRQPDQELLNVLATIGSQIGQFIERKRAEAEARDSERRYHEVQAELAHASRVATMGQLTASIAHEVTQPIASVRNNARAALNYLDQQPPDLSEIKEALESAVADADRAGHIVDRIRDHIKKAPPRKDCFDLNEAINEVIALTRSAIIKNGASVQTQLASELFPVQGDRVQLQQVVLNLILNALEAMGSIEVGARQLLISTEQNRTDGILVAVRDSGPGIEPDHLERVFQAFYTTKSDGMGMGLSICRSIIEAQGGRLWADANEPRGAVFLFTLPKAENS
jgi:PAS domain S-box-containing protein